jgi:hypothetical protein
MLPAGMTLEQASAGFRNQGQFVAALNASKSRNIPFDQLQKAMTVDGLSLGQAMQSLKGATTTTPPPTTTTPPPTGTTPPPTGTTPTPPPPTTTTTKVKKSSQGGL